MSSDTAAMTASQCMEALAENVHWLRRRERRSQKDLAAQVGCSPTTISNLEQGKLSAISFEHLVSLANHFEVTVDFLIGRERVDEAGERNGRPQTRR